MHAVLPRWPIAAMFIPFPLWWVLGVAEMAWIPIVGAMAALLLRQGRVRVPRGTGIFLLFLVLMLASVIGIDTPGRMIGFGYRALQYVSVIIAFIYVYNARSRIDLTWLLGVLTVFWTYVVAGGWLAVVAPRLSFRTPLGYVLPGGLQANELVHEMVVRRTTQWNPDSWFQFDPRPSAPFLYTNGWGNAYSLLLPLVIAYLIRMPRDRRWVGLLALIPISAVPAFLTLNRGMFIGLAAAGLWATVRLLAAGRLRGVLALGLGGLLGLVAAWSLGVGDRLNDRLANSSTTENRADLYLEAITRTLDSPLFGYGAPRPSFTEGAPSVGTQGQIWSVLFSHGFPAAVVFLASLTWLFLATRHWRRHGAAGLVIHTVLGVLLLEVFYYGVLPVGLMVAFLIAASVLPGRCDGTPFSEAVPRARRPSISPTPQGVS